jgi:hypothetical protein
VVFTVIFTTLVDAHCPAVGVKVYVPDAVLLTVAGDHVPVYPLFDVVANVGAVLPEQNAAIELNDGVTGAFTVTLILAVLAHCPAVGVKVYVPEVVLLTVAGDHDPIYPLFDVVANIGAVLPEQNAAIELKVGVTCTFTVTLILAVLAHCPAVGVKVYVPDAVLLTVAGDHVPV